MVQLLDSESHNKAEGHAPKIPRRVVSVCGVGSQCRVFGASLLWGRYVCDRSRKVQIRQ